MYTMDLEAMMKKEHCVPNTTSPALGMHKNSQMISKVKPKIRIIHIFAPEIIKTDVANFRELVQRLTGKPTENGDGAKNKKKPTRFHRTEKLADKKMEVRKGFLASECGQRIMGAEEIWDGANSGGGFLGGFADLDGFMQELHGIPLLPLDAYAPHVDSFAESQLV